MARTREKLRRNLREGQLDLVIGRILDSVSAAELAGAGVNPGSTLNVRFTAIDAANGSIVEAGVDGFAVREITCDPSAVGVRYCTPAVVNCHGAFPEHRIAWPRSAGYRRPH